MKKTYFYFHWCLFGKHNNKSISNQQEVQSWRRMNSARESSNMEIDILWRQSDLLCIIIYEFVRYKGQTKLDMLDKWDRYHCSMIKQVHNLAATWKDWGTSQVNFMKDYKDFAQRMLLPPLLRSIDREIMHETLIRSCLCIREMLGLVKLRSTIEPA